MGLQGSPATPKSYNISDLKSKFLNIAQTSVYLVKLQPPGNVVTLLNQRGFNYSSEGEDLELLCSETALPGSSLATHESTNDYHGVTEKMAYRRIYDETINFTFYVDYDYKVNEFFETWMDYVVGQENSTAYKNRTTPYRMNFPEKYKSSIYLTKFEKDPTEISSKNVLYYTFVDAFPISITSSPVSYDQSQLLKMNVSFSYVRYVRERNKVNVPRIPDVRSPQATEANSNLNGGRKIYNRQGTGPNPNTTGPYPVPRR